METMSISRLAEATHISTDTIRYYEKFGLLPEIERSVSGYREYHQEHVRRLHFISKCKRMGYTLSEIKTVLRSELYDTIQKLYGAHQMDQDEIEILKDLLHVKINDLQEQQKQIANQLGIISIFMERLDGEFESEMNGCILDSIPDQNCIIKNA